MLASFPAALITGIVGIFRDQRRGLAAAVTAIVGGIIVLWLVLLGTFVLCR